jgi:hypothetical protein
MCRYDADCAPKNGWLCRFYIKSKRESMQKASQTIVNSGWISIRLAPQPLTIHLIQRKFGGHNPNSKIKQREKQRALITWSEYSCNL